MSAKQEIDGKIVWNTHTNYQAKASLVRKNPVKTDFPHVRGAKVKRLKFNVNIPKREKKLDIILPDSQIGYKKDMTTGKLEQLKILRALLLLLK